MFDYIKGTIEFVGPEYIVIENQGIGFQVIAPNPFIFSNQIRAGGSYIYVPLCP